MFSRFNEQHVVPLLALHQHQDANRDTRRIEVDITSEGLLTLLGQFYLRVSHKAETPLVAGVLGLESCKAGAAVPWSGAASSARKVGRCRLVDGELASSSPTSLSSGASVMNAGTALRVGLNATPPHVFQVRALFDDVQIYTQALTSGEVAWLYNHAVLAVPEPGSWLLAPSSAAFLLLTRSRRKRRQRPASHPSESPPPGVWHCRPSIDRWQ